MFYLFLDEVYNNSIRNKRIEVFGDSFQHHNGLIQNTAGKQRIFYNTGKNIATVNMPQINAKAIFQHANVGILQQIENEKIENWFFKIKGLNMELAKKSVENLSQFTFMPTMSSFLKSDVQAVL